jgi:hypothetical protein
MITIQSLTPHETTTISGPVEIFIFGQKWIENFDSKYHNEYLDWIGCWLVCLNCLTTEIMVNNTMFSLHTVTEIVVKIIMFSKQCHA